MRVIIVAALIGLAATGCASAQTGAAGSGASGSAVGSTAGPTLPVGPPTGAPGSGGSGTRSGPPIGGTSAKPSAPSDNSPVNVRCPAQLPQVEPNGPDAKPLPAGIHVTWVLRCSVVSKAGTARRLLAERSDSDPTKLLNALRVPSGPRIKGVCPMFRMLVPYFALVQSNGRVLAPKIPLNSCGMIDPAVVQALSGMRFEVLSDKPLP